MVTSAHRARAPTVMATFFDQAPWELDFFSRPILDRRGKKVWELLITDSDSSFVFSEFFASNEISSSNLRKALENFIKTNAFARPREVKYFRSQMQTVISRALRDMEIKAVPSRRCFGLMDLLEQRSYGIGGVSGTMGISMLESSVGFSALETLPDQLKGERWEFVSLPASELRKEAQAVFSGNIIGAAVDIDRVANITEETNIPGLVVFSRRAKPLAAWTMGYELAALSNSFDRACVVLETGINQRWLYAPYPQSALNDMVAKQWEKAKKSADGLHFLAVQENSEALEVEGLWIMQERSLPV